MADKTITKILNSTKHTITLQKTTDNGTATFTIFDKDKNNKPESNEEFEAENFNLFLPDEIKKFLEESNYSTNSTTKPEGLFIELKNKKISIEQEKKYNLGSLAGALGVNGSTTANTNTNTNQYNSDNICALMSGNYGKPNVDSKTLNDAQCEYSNTDMGVYSTAEFMKKIFKAYHLDNLLTGTPSSTQPTTNNPISSNNSSNSSVITFDESIENIRTNDEKKKTTTDKKKTTTDKKKTTTDNVDIEDSKPLATSSNSKKEVKTNGNNTKNTTVHKPHHDGGRIKELEGGNHEEWYTEKYKTYVDTYDKNDCLIKIEHNDGAGNLVTETYNGDFNKLLTKKYKSGDKNILETYDGREHLNNSSKPIKKNYVDDDGNPLSRVDMVVNNIYSISIKPGVEIIKTVYKMDDVLLKTSHDYLFSDYDISNGDNKKK